MQPPEVDSPGLTDANCTADTGRTLKQWFAVLDERGGMAIGRRDLVASIYDDCRKHTWWSVTIVVEYEKARGQQEKDGLPTAYSICSTKTIAAPLANVFAAFTDTAVLAGWFGKPAAMTFTRVRDGKDLRGEWRGGDVAPGSKLDVLFADKGKGKVGITLNHTRIQDRRDADRLREGWSGCFDRLKALLESA